MKLRTDGQLLRDDAGRHRVFHGINLVAKGTALSEGSFVDRGFKGSWDEADIADLASRGFTLIRLGIIWAAIEPQPGEYDSDYLDWVKSQLDLIAAAGMCAVLDAHQDLYSQSYSDGAPPWATLTSHEFAATDLWSDAYLASPAVHEALDNFWANTAGPGGVGLQDRFAAMWAHVAQRPGPIRRWPATTSLMSQHREAQNLRFLPTSLAADFSDPQAKFSQLDHLNDEDVHRQIGDSLHPLVAAFETELVAPLMARVVSAVRQVDPHTLICESTTILPTWASRRVSHHLRTATGRTPPLPC